MALTINEQEQKKAYELCEAIVIGFQNEAKNKVVYEALQEVYERIHEEVQPILDKEIIEANEAIGVTTLSRFLGIKEFYAKWILEKDDYLLNMVSGLENADIPNVKACYVGDYHQQIMIEGDCNGEYIERVISIYWSGEEDQ